MAVSFLALYRGQSVADAELVGISARRHLVALVADVMASDLPSTGNDPVAKAKHDGHRRALELVRKDAEER